MKERIPISPAQTRKLLKKNAYACCVCKSRGIGLNFHHLDNDPSNNNDDNIAVLCVSEHDCHHRPKAYSSINHLDLSADELKRKKERWEKFVSEAKKENPSVLAVITAYGSEEKINGMKIVFQWRNGDIEFERVYQLLDAPMDVWIDRAIKEVFWIGKNIKLVVIDKPVPIEYCPDCSNAISRTLDENVAIKLTVTDWKEKSLCTVYLNPRKPSLAFTIFYNSELVYQVSIHKCGNDLHYMDEKHSERYPIVSNYKTREQVIQLLKKCLMVWDLEKLIIGTGNPDNPDIIEKLELPEVWEKAL